jgi:hypothetical protein
VSETWAENCERNYKECLDRERIHLEQLQTLAEERDKLQAGLEMIIEQSVDDWSVGVAKHFLLGEEMPEDDA